MANAQSATRSGVGTRRGFAPALCPLSGVKRTCCACRKFQMRAALICADDLTRLQDVDWDEIVSGPAGNGYRTEERIGDARAVAGVLAVFPFFFSLVLALQLPQQRPREDHGQDEAHEKGKNDINGDHKN